MLERSIVFEIHRLKHLGLPESRIASELGISRPAVIKYLKDPDRKKRWKEQDVQA